MEGNVTIQSYPEKDLEYLMTIPEEANEETFLKYLPKVVEALSFQIVVLSKLVEKLHSAIHKVFR